MCPFFLCHQLGTPVALLLPDPTIMCLGHTETCKVTGTTGEMNHERRGGQFCVCLCSEQESSSLEDDPLPGGETQGISFPSATYGTMWPRKNIIKIQKTRPLLNQKDTRTVAGRLAVLSKCLLNGCNGILLLLFSESQESAELLHHKV